MIRRALLILAVIAIASTAARAQSRVTVAPSVSVGWVYDDNLFYQPSAESEGILRFTSGLSLVRETSRNETRFDISFDLERFSERRTLSTPFARQTLLMRTRHQASPRVTVDLEGGFDSTRAPAELNLTTGLLTGRRRAYRAHAEPGVTVLLTPTSRLTTDYTINADIVPKGTLLVAGTDTPVNGAEPVDIVEVTEPASRLLTHVGAVQYGHGLTPRAELRVDYVARWFMIGNLRSTGPGAPIITPAQTIGTHTAMIGGAFRLTPALRLEASAGPRFLQSGGGIDGIEAQALLWRQRTTYDVFASYVRSVTTAVGLRSLVEVDRAVFRAVYRPPFGIQTEGQVGYYRNTVDEQTISAFQVSGGITVPVAGPVSVGASYDIDFQRGRFTSTLPVTVVPGVDPILDPNAPLRRGVAMIRLVIAPQVRRRPEDPPPGATPSRPPVKRSDK